MHVLIPVFDDPKHPRINRILKEQALPCPECGETQELLNLLIENRAIAPRFAVGCSKCKHQGLFGKDAYDAIKKWNEPPSILSALKQSWGKRRKRLRKVKTKRWFL